MCANIGENNVSHPLHDATPQDEQEQKSRSLADEADALQRSLRGDESHNAQAENRIQNYSDVYDDTEDDASYEQPLGKPHDAMPAPSMSRTMFMRSMGFDEESLRANEQGFVTKAQRTRIKQMLKSEADAMWLYLTIFIAVSIVIALIMQSSGIPMIYLIVAGGIFFGAFFFTTYRRQTGMTADGNVRTLEKAQGIMQLEFGGLGEDRRYWLRVGNEKFRIGMHTFRALAEQSHNGYLGAGRVYYAPQSRILLAGEVFDHDDIEKRKNDDMDFAEKLKNHEVPSDDDWRGWDDIEEDQMHLRQPRR
jgi:hypothetical protein